MVSDGKRVLMVEDDERLDALEISNGVATEELIMDTGHADADEAVLNMLQRYKVLMMEDLIIGRPDFSWAQLFLAVDRLSRKNLIALRPIGLSYQIRPMSSEWTHGQEQQHEEPAAAHR